MPIGDPVGRETTYGQAEELIKARTGTLIDGRFPTPLIYKEISLSIQKLQGVLKALGDPFYLVTNSSLSISGSANPYTIDTSALAIDKIVRLTHVGSSLRTRVKFVSQDEAEALVRQSIHASSIFGVWEGDVIRLYKGASFTMGSNSPELKYLRQPFAGTVSTGAVVLDNDFTATGTIITGFTGTLASHVGGTFVGTDNGGNPFVRSIVSYVSSTSFQINSALVAGGAGTGGYIVPPHVQSIGASTKLDIRDKYIPLVILDVTDKVLKMKGISDSTIQAEIAGMLGGFFREFGVSKELEDDVR